MLCKTSLLSAENGRPWTINDLMPSIVENQSAMQPQSSTIVLLAAFLSEYANDKIVTMSQNECQRSVYD